MMNQQQVDLNHTRSATYQLPGKASNQKVEQRQGKE